MRAIVLGLIVLGFCLAARPSEAQLIHRWSFDSDVSDSVGEAHGNLMEGATVNEGRVELDGENNFVELPIGETVGSLTDFTIESWTTWNELQGPWTRIFDFGADQNSYMFLSPRHGRPVEEGPADSIRFAITTGGFGEEQLVDAPEALPVGEETYVAVTLDAENDVASLYVNGELVGSQEGVTLTPSDLGNTPNNWLGGGQFFELDPVLNGSISELRIYNRALSPEEIALSYQLGPDKLEPDPPAASEGGMAASTCCCQPQPCCGRTHRHGRRGLLGGLFGRRCR